jgi:hypothetical protein
MHDTTSRNAFGKGGMKLLASLLAATAMPATISPALAMMPPWVYEAALESAAAMAELQELEVSFDAERATCHVSGTVAALLPRQTQWRESLPSRRKREQPNAEALPAIGTRLSLTVACFSADGPGPMFGAYFQFVAEQLQMARTLTVPVDARGAVVEAYGAGMYIGD